MSLSITLDWIEQVPVMICDLPLSTECLNETIMKPSFFVEWEILTIDLLESTIGKSNNLVK